MADPSADVQGRIFISYRRDDTAYPAGWLYDRLVERFGAEQIFKDVDSIELGDDFVAVLTEAVGSTDVLLALIGDKWLTITGEDGERRLDDPEDFVRLEIEAALTQKVRVIPILVEGAEMPAADELPASLAPLSRRQALELSSSRFTFDSDRLLAVLERTLSEAAGVADEREPAVKKEPAPTDDGPSWRQRLRERPRLLLAVAGAAVLLLLAIGGAVLLSGRDDPETGGLAAEDAAADDAASDDQAASDDSTSTASVPTPPANGPVAFVSDQTGSEEIWSLAPGEAEPTRLTSGFGDVRRPNWSPDGTKVAFASNRGNAASDFDIWVLDAAEGSTRRLTSGTAEDGAPAWSPDGTEHRFRPAGARCRHEGHLDHERRRWEAPAGHRRSSRRRRARLVDDEPRRVREQPRRRLRDPHAEPDRDREGRPAGDRQRVGRPLARLVAGRPAHRLPRAARRGGVRHLHDRRPPVGARAGSRTTARSTTGPRGRPTAVSSPSTRETDDQTDIFDGSGERRRRCRP